MWLSVYLSARLSHDGSSPCSNNEDFPNYPAHLAIKADGIAGLTVLVPRHTISQKRLSKIDHQSALF